MYGGREVRNHYRLNDLIVTVARNNLHFPAQQHVFPLTAQYLIKVETPSTASLNKQ